MSSKEIFTNLANRMIGAMMIHTQLHQIFTLLDLLPDARKQQSQLEEETHGYAELNKYFCQFHHMVLEANNPPQIDLLNLGLLKKTSFELTPEDRVYLMKYAMNEWINWEKDSKVLYEDSYRNLIDISEIASADFVMRFVNDVSRELKDAETLFRVREGINWDLSTIYDKQSRSGKR